VKHYQVSTDEWMMKKVAINITMAKLKISEKLSLRRAEKLELIWDHPDIDRIRGWTGLKLKYQLCQQQMTLYWRKKLFDQTRKRISNDILQQHIRNTQRKAALDKGRKILVDRDRKRFGEMISQQHIAKSQRKAAFDKATKSLSEEISLRYLEKLELLCEHPEIDRIIGWTGRKMKYLLCQQQIVLYWQKSEDSVVGVEESPHNSDHVSDEGNFVVGIDDSSLPIENPLHNQPGEGTDEDPCCISDPPLRPRRSARIAMLPIVNYRETKSATTKLRRSSRLACLERLNYAFPRLARLEQLS
jgi:hypothetical protein